MPVPLGSGAFSVGLSGGWVVVVVVVVVVVLPDSSGVPLSLLQPAVKPIIAMTAPPPNAVPIRRNRRSDDMFDPLLVLSVNFVGLKARVPHQSAVQVYYIVHLLTLHSRVGRP